MMPHKNKLPETKPIFWFVMLFVAKRFLESILVYESQLNISVRVPSFKNLWSLIIFGNMSRLVGSCLQLLAQSR